MGQVEDQENALESSVFILHLLLGLDLYNELLDEMLRVTYRQNRRGERENGRGGFMRLAPKLGGDSAVESDWEITTTGGNVKGFAIGLVGTSKCSYPVIPVVIIKVGHKADGWY